MNQETEVFPFPWISDSRRSRFLEGFLSSCTVGSGFFVFHAPHLTLFEGVKAWCYVLLIVKGMNASRCSGPFLVFPFARDFSSTSAIAIARRICCTVIFVYQYVLYVQLAMTILWLVAENITFLRHSA